MTQRTARSTTKKKKLLPYVSYPILELNLQQLQGGREGGREERREGGKT